MKNIIFWSEFPEKVDWKKLQKLLEELDYRIAIYVPCKTEAQYIWWKQEIKKIAPNVQEINVWPILEKKDGYWFSGFTEVYNIDKLDQFKGHKIKIDLEMPPPFYKYNLRFIIKYILMYIFKKAPNNNYLINKIFNLNKDSAILVNEFPVPKFFLKRWGCYVPAKRGIKKNIMCYSTIFPRFYIKQIMKKAFRENKDISVSIGLIGPGILKTEPVYKGIKQFKKDLNLVRKIGIKNVAIYSIESILKRKEPRQWLTVLKEFSGQ